MLPSLLTANLLTFATCKSNNNEFILNSLFEGKLGLWVLTAMTGLNLYIGVNFRLD